MFKPDRSFTGSMKDWVPGQVGGGYRFFTGSLAYVLHRVTGLGLIIFLFFHILSITKATTEFWKYDVLMHRFQSPDFKVGELGLYFALLFHGINGIRILLVDFVFDRSHVSKKIFWVFLGLIIVLFVLGCIPLILHWNTAPLMPAVNASSGG